MFDCNDVAVFLPLLTVFCCSWLIVDSVLWRRKINELHAMAKLLEGRMREQNDKEEKREAQDALL